MVTASSDKTARVWDAATGKPLTSALEHLEPVRSAAFSPDGTRVVTASWDKTARVWDLRLDAGALADWVRIARRSLFVFDGSVLVLRSRTEKLDDQWAPCVIDDVPGGRKAITRLRRGHRRPS